MPPSKPPKVRKDAFDRVLKKLVQQAPISRSSKASKKKSK